MISRYRAPRLGLTVRADVLIRLERPRWLCLCRVLWRALLQRRRPDLPVGCLERPDAALLEFIWNFEKNARPEVEAARLAHGPNVPVIRLRSERATAALPTAQLGKGVTSLALH